MPAQGNGRSQQPSGRPRTPALEWATVAAGLSITLATVGFLIYDGADPDSAPRLTARVERVVPYEGLHQIEFVVENSGGSTAAKVSVSGTLRQKGATVESASTTFDYVPAHSRVHGGVIFVHDPDGYALSLDVKAYTVP